jgi:hypothetical protein
LAFRLIAGNNHNTIAAFRRFHYDSIRDAVSRWFNGKRQSDRLLRRFQFPSVPPALVRHLQLALASQRHSGKSIVLRSGAPAAVDPVVQRVYSECADGVALKIDPVTPGNPQRYEAPRQLQILPRDLRAIRCTTTERFDWSVALCRGALRVGLGPSDKSIRTG